MSELLLILVGTALVNNVVLTRFLGVCPFIGASERMETAFALALATSFVLVLATLLTSLIEVLLLAPLDAGYLRLVCYLLLIAATVQLPLVASNCAVLGVTLLNVGESHSVLRSLVFGLGTAAGFTLVLALFAGLRERVEVADVPGVFRGTPIALVTAALMALAFMGFSGLFAE